MGVPESVRKVPRPVNTVVGDSGKDGPNRYPVRERDGVIYVPGGNPQPKNGKVIGHIVDGVYVPLKKQLTEPEMLSFGAGAFIRSVSEDLFAELLNLYPPADASTMMAAASLRVIRPKASVRRLWTQYRQSFISRYYPEAGLSEDVLRPFLQHLGRDEARRLAFFRRRVEATAADHPVTISRILRRDPGTVSNLTAFSCRGGIGSFREEDSILCVYDITAMEPVCAETFPGSSPDAAFCSAFIRNHGIRRGIIAADRDFPPPQFIKEMAERPDLRLVPSVPGNDPGTADRNMPGFLEGVVPPEADQDPETVRLCLESQWLPELVFSRYGSRNDPGSPDGQSRFSAVGNEFISFLSAVLTCRLIRKAREAELLNSMSFGDLLDDLHSAWRKADAPEDPATDDHGWVHTPADVFREMEALGLSRPAPGTEPGKRGRKKTGAEENLTKRPRGRPRKKPDPAGGKPQP